VGHAAAGGPHRHILEVGPACGTTVPCLPGGARRQIFYDDLFLFMYDINLEFVIILCAKAPSLVTHDENGNFVIESARSVTNFSVVTTESSLLNTFLVVNNNNNIVIMFIIMQMASNLKYEMQYQMTSRVINTRNYNR